jgi:hypothetical protein
MYGKFNLKGRFSPSFAVRHKLLLIFSNFRDFNLHTPVELVPLISQVNVTAYRRLMFTKKNFLKMQCSKSSKSGCLRKMIVWRNGTENCLFILLNELTLPQQYLCLFDFHVVHCIQCI